MLAVYIYLFKCFAGILLLALGINFLAEYDTPRKRVQRARRKRRMARRSHL